MYGPKRRSSSLQETKSTYLNTLINISRTNASIEVLSGTILDNGELASESVDATDMALAFLSSIAYMWEHMGYELSGVWWWWCWLTRNKCQKQKNGEAPFCDTAGVQWTLPAEISYSSHKYISLSKWCSSDYFCPPQSSSSSIWSAVKFANTLAGSTAFSSFGPSKSSTNSRSPYHSYAPSI